MSSLEVRLTRELAELERKGRRRRLGAPRGIPFTSNDYLALSVHPAVRRALVAALERGIEHGATGSRLLSGNHPLHTEAERAFARFVGRETALLFGSGYAANLALFSCLPARRDLIVLDQECHASIREGARASTAQRRWFPHNDPVGLRRVLHDRDRYDDVFIAVEGLYSMDGDTARLQELDAVAAEFRAHLVVDEAHATGLFGAHLRGVHEDAGLTRKPLATVHPCGKALGCAGAFIAADETVTEYLVNRGRPFIFSTAPPPLVAAALGCAVGLLDEMHDRARSVLAGAAVLRSRLAALQRWTVPPGAGPIVPLLIGPDAEAVAASDLLARHGFDVRAIRPPTVAEGSARLRITVTAHHTSQDIHALADVIESAEHTLACESHGG